MSLSSKLSFRLASVLLWSPLALGCGGAAPEADSPASEAEAATAEDPGEAAPAAEETSSTKPKPKDDGLPTSCASNEEGFCTPPAKFVKRICGKDFPTVALTMFSSAMPWTHGYLTRKTRAWSASGAGSSNEELPAGEEVVVLEHRGAAALGGMEVSGASGGFEVLRWDGSCVTLQAGELTTDPVPKVHNARIVWNSLEVDTREALREDEGVNLAYRTHRKECKGVSMGEVSSKCVGADRELNDAIVKYIRDGGRLPVPHKLP